MEKRDAERFTRTLGRRLIDLTGNGPPSRGDRIRQALRLTPQHPTYTIFGRTFLSSHPTAGALEAHVRAPALSMGPSQADLCVIQTKTGTKTNNLGVDGDFDVVVDCDLLGANQETAWEDISPKQAASRLARIGRHLVHATFATTDNRRMAKPHLLLCDKPKVTNFAVYFLEAALAYSGYDDVVAVLELPTPNAPATVVFTNPALTMSAPLSQLINSKLLPRLTVAYAETALRVSRDRLLISVTEMSAVDKMKLVREAAANLENAKFRAADLSLLEGAPPSS